MKTFVADTSLEGLSVLVVDGNRHFRSVIRNLLHAMQVERVVEAIDVRAALEILKTEPVDLVLTCLVMEPINGVKLIEWIRGAKGANFQALPIVGMTAHSELETILKARDAGINGVLVKPLSAQQLERHIKEALKGTRPFIRAKSFTGPDRRHKDNPYMGPERRNDMGFTEGAAN